MDIVYGILIIIGIIVLFVVLGLSGWVAKGIGFVFDFLAQGVGGCFGCFGRIIWILFLILLLFGILASL